MPSNLFLAATAGRKPVTKVLLAIVLTVPLTAAQTMAGAAGHAPRGQSGDHRRGDPCDHAVEPNGHAHGLHAQCPPAGGGGTAKGDFNGDGIGDLAVGSPLEDVGDVEAAGMVHVIYGTANGLAPAGNQFLHQNVTGVNGTPTFGDNYGHALAAGHFNDDPYSDLAVGVPGEALGGFAKVGVVNVLYGSAAGLRTDNDQTWDYQDLPSSMALSAGADLSFWGYSLAWADFNGDGTGDLAVGTPNTSEPGVGAVVILYGTDTALGIFGAQEFRSNQFQDGTGDVLTAGDYNSDGFGDLVIGAPFYDFLGPADFGTVYVVDGGPPGLDFGGRLQLVQDAQEENDRFGSALATGDLNGDGRDDLAVGTPLEDLENNSKVDAGFVDLYFGVPPNDTSFGRAHQVLSQGTAVERGDRFGFALAAGDFNGDGRDDLAVGVPGEAIGTIANAGIVQVFPGGTNGVSINNSRVWHQNVTDVAGTAEAGDQFGSALSAWNFGGGTQADLAVGIPYEDGTTPSGQRASDSGAVQVIYGSTTGLTATGNQQWTQNDLSGSGSEPDDRFGQSVY